MPTPTLAPIETPKVTCPCQQCGAPIQFQSADFGKTIICPHCSKDTILYIPEKREESESHPGFVYKFFAVLFLIIGVIEVLEGFFAGLLAIPLIAGGFITFILALILHALGRLIEINAKRMPKESA